MVEKLVILAYANESFKRYAARFTAQINPESYSHLLAIRLEKRRTTNPAGVSPCYKGHPPQELELEFVLDGAGAADSPSQSLAAIVNHSVTKRIDELLAAVYNFDGGIHRSRYLKVCWDTLVVRVRGVDAVYRIYAVERRRRR